MTNAPTGANAPAMPNRRTALGSIAAAGAAMLAAPAIAKAATGDELAGLIEAHRAAFAAYLAAIDAAEAAEPPADAFVMGIGGAQRYSLACRFEDIATSIEEDFVLEVANLYTLLRLDPALGAAAQDRLIAEKAAAYARAEAALSVKIAADDALSEAGDAESEAILAICAHRCGSMGEVAAKARYLADYPCELQSEHIGALLGSMLPEV